MDRVGDAYIEVSPTKLVAKINYNETPLVKVEGALIKIGTPLTLGFSESKILSRESRGGAEVLVIENPDIKIRVEETSVSLIVEGLRSYSLEKLDLVVNDRKYSTLVNILSRPFTSIWIYSRGVKKLYIMKHSEKHYSIRIE